MWENPLRVIEPGLTRVVTITEVLDTRASGLESADVGSSEQVNLGLTHASMH